MLIPGHEVMTVPDAGWSGIKNGELLKKAASAFDVFVTVDLNLAFQHPASLPLPVITINASSTKLKDLAAFIPQLLTLLQSKPAPRIHSIGE